MNRSPHAGRRPNAHLDEIMALLQKGMRHRDIATRVGVTYDVVEHVRKTRFKRAALILRSASPPPQLAKWGDRNCGQCLQPAPNGIVVVTLEAERVKSSYLWCGQCDTKPLVVSESVT